MKPGMMRASRKDVLRKEKPLPAPKPPVRPPAPPGVRVPGASGSPGGMVCERMGRG